MGTFIDDPSATLPGPKRDVRAVPSGADRNGYLDADSYNAVRSALLDVKTAVQPGADLSDRKVTALGAPAGKDLAAWARNASAPRLIDVLDITAALHSSNPSQVLIDEWVDVTEYGLVVSSNFYYLDAIVEAQVNGEWVTTGVMNYSSMPPGVTRPSFSPGYLAEYGFVGGNLHAPVESLSMLGSISVGADMGNDPVSAEGTFVPNPGHRMTRLRVVARADCSSGLHDAKGYRLRLRVRVPDLAVWSKEVPVPVADGAYLLDEPVIDLADLGITTFQNEMAVVAVLKRGGKTIRPFGAIVEGEPLDPPTYPVVVAARVVADGYDWWANQNGPESAIAGGQPVAAGSYFGDTLADCTEWINTKVKIAAWRSGAALTEYLDVQPTYPDPGTPIACPAGSADGCTLLVKILRAPSYAKGAFPFLTPNGPDGQLRGGTRAAFVSGEVLGTGTPQDVPHNMIDDAFRKVSPVRVAVLPVKWPAASACAFTESHDDTNVTVTMTNGVTYVVMAWPPTP